MTGTVRLLVGLSIAVATLCLAAAYMSSSWYAALVMLGVGLLWLSVLRHGNSRVADWGLFFFVMAAVWGGLQALAWGWLLAAVIAGLAGWDLTHYLAHLQATPERQGEEELVRRHLLRLAGVCIGGGLLAGVTLLATVQLNLIGALLLAGSGIVALTAAVRSLRRRSL